MLSKKKNIVHVFSSLLLVLVDSAEALGTSFFFRRLLDATVHLNIMCSFFSSYSLFVILIYS